MCGIFSIYIFYSSPLCEFFFDAKIIISSVISRYWWHGRDPLSQISPQLNGHLLSFLPHSLARSLSHRSISSISCSSSNLKINGSSNNNRRSKNILRKLPRKQQQNWKKEERKKIKFRIITISRLAQHTHQLREYITILFVWECACVCVCV